MTISLRQNQEDYLIKIAKSNFKIDALHTSTRNQTDDLVIDVFSDSAGIDAGASSGHTVRSSPDFDVIAATNVTLLTDLTAYWKLDEASGTRSDSIGANDLTDNNTVTQAVGIVGNAGQFTAANSEWLSIADNAALSMGDIDFSIAAWVYLDDKSLEVIVHKGTGGAAAQSEYFLSYVAGSDRFRLSVQNGATSGSVSANSFGSPPTGVFIFIVVWHDSIANTINIQVNNGTVDSTSYSGGSFDSTGGFAMGRFSDGSFGSEWDGRIDEVGIWKKVLTALERSDLYNSGAGRTHPFTDTGTAGTATVQSIAFASTTGIPSKAMIISDETLNTGTITYSISRDGGTTFTTVTKETLTDISAQPSGTSMKWKVVIIGDAELNDIALAWKT